MTKSRLMKTEEVRELHLIRATLLKNEPKNKNFHSRLSFLFSFTSVRGRWDFPFAPDHKNDTHQEASPLDANKKFSARGAKVKPAAPDLIDTIS